MDTHPYANSFDLRRMLDALMVWRLAQPDGDYEHVGDLLWSFQRQAKPERNVRLWEEAGRLAGFMVVDPDWGTLLYQAHPDTGKGVRRELFD